MIENLIAIYFLGLVGCLLVQACIEEEFTELVAAKLIFWPIALVKWIVRALIMVIMA